MNHLIHSRETRIRPLCPNRRLPNLPTILATSQLLLDELKEKRHEFQGNILEVTGVERDRLQCEEGSADFVSDLLSHVVERIDVPEFIFMSESVSIAAAIQPNLTCVIRFSNSLKTSRITESTADER